jgi:hypothetical protein
VKTQTVDLTSITLSQAMSDPALFGPHFEPAESWTAWRVFVKALFGEPLDDAEVEVWKQHTGRDLPPCSSAREGWLICGRRAGKSRMMATNATFLACFRDHTEGLAPGEMATIKLIAADRDQAGTLKRFVEIPRHEHRQPVPETEAAPTGLR